MVRRVKIGEEWKIIGLYVNERVEKRLDEVRMWIEGKEERTAPVIGSDFNARIGKKGGEIKEEEKEEMQKIER